MREVLATPAELLNAASGKPITVRTPDGDEVRLRIPTVDEYRAEEARACDRLYAAGLHVPTLPDDSLVRSILRPLPGTIGVL
ncbi:hypothetical protein [Microtetraspora malaysiensis]|uniref:hypothetical protein n=1 Tax=Microtetraspora malaysiensis TaxID=161358 RepID=UPI003D944601